MAARSPSSFAAASAAPCVDRNVGHCAELVRRCGTMREKRGRARVARKRAEQRGRDRTSSVSCGKANAASGTRNDEQRREDNRGGGGDGGDGLSANMGRKLANH
ncbi:unnamed protein product [Lampetra fluviatilis]